MEFLSKPVRAVAKFHYYACNNPSHSHATYGRAQRCINDQLRAEAQPRLKPLPGVDWTERDQQAICMIVMRAFGMKWREIAEAYGWKSPGRPMQVIKWYQESLKWRTYKSTPFFPDDR